MILKMIRKNGKIIAIQEITHHITKYIGKDYPADIAIKDIERDIAAINLTSTL